MVISGSWRMGFGDELRSGECCGIVGFTAVFWESCESCLVGVELPVFLELCLSEFATDTLELAFLDPSLAGIETDNLSPVDFSVPSLSGNGSELDSEAYLRSGFFQRL